MNPLADEKTAIGYGMSKTCAEIYEQITNDICVPCINDACDACQSCKVIQVKELITEYLERI